MRPSRSPTASASGHYVQSLLASQDLLHSGIEQCPSGILIFEAPDVRIRYANPAAIDICGGNAWPMTGGEEAATGPLPQIFRADNQTPFPHEELPLSRAVRLGETSLNVEMVIRRPDGEARWIIASAVPVRNPQGRIVAGISVFHDVTTQKQFEFSLRSSEEQYRIVFESTSTPLMIMRADTVIVMCNPAFERLTGYSREETEGHLSWTHFVVPAEVERLKAFHVQRRIDPASVPSGYEFQMVDRQGNVKDIATSIAMLSDHTHSLASLYDITIRKQSERALAESENLYRAIFDNTGTASIIIEEDATIALANPEWLQLTGFSKEETEGKQHWTQFVVPEDLERMMGYHRDRRESPEKAPRKYEFRFVRRNGEIRDILNSVTVIPGTRRSLASLIDVTELKHAEAALRQKQKLESLGLLAGGIAHDFNNILTAAIGHLNLAQLNVSDASPAGHNLKMLEQALLKAANLTRQMLAYSGKGKFVVRVLNLNMVIQEMLPLCQVGISKKTVIQFLPSQTPARIEADTAQLQQVVMNLVTNAADAIGEREGTITLKTTIEEVSEPLMPRPLQQQGLRPGRYVVLEVSDTGCGMSREIIARIFDPFFSTKATGRGLGLSALLGILRGHRAGILIESEPGQGSTFRILLPEAGSDEPPSPETGTVHAERFSGVVLLVDDEECIRTSIGQALRHFGFDVVVAADGEEALNVVRERGNELRLVLLDLTMPRMDGRQAFEAIHRMHPGMPVILSSGYNEQDTIQRFHSEGLAAFIQKPYPVHELRKLIARVLTQKNRVGGPPVRD